nr:prolyl-tRNA synthetase associated domain-containing protein [Senegalia massiliensis]
MNIEYELIEHPEVFTIEEARKYTSEEGIKNLFLTNKKKNKFFLVLINEDTKMDIKSFEEYIGEKRIKFANEKYLEEKMNTKPGAVSLFGLLNNEEKDIQVYLDTNIAKKEEVTFHPNNNTKTIIIKTGDMYKFLKELGYDYKFISI